MNRATASVLTLAGLLVLLCVVTGPLRTAAGLLSNVPTQPCATEDSSGPCYWNAATQGNHEGTSFHVDSSGKVTYGG